MSEQVINIAKDFSEYPGPRYRRDGKFSGEEFRENLLLPRLQEAISNQQKLVVVLDDVAGYGSSFLEESFGGLLRRGIRLEDIRKYLSVQANTSRFQHHKRRAEIYMHDAARHIQ